MKARALVTAAMLWIVAAGQHALAQAEVSGWGNLRGIRIGGQLVPFTTALGIYNSNFTRLTLSQREGPTRTIRYARSGNTVTVSANLQDGGRGGPVVGGGFGGATGFNFTVGSTDVGPGTCDVRVQVTSVASQTIGGVFYFICLPRSVFAGGTTQVVSGSNVTEASLSVPNDTGRYLTASGNGIRLRGKHRETVEVTFPKPREIIVQDDRNGSRSDIQVSFPFATGNTVAGQTMDLQFTLQASTDVDRRPVEVTVDPSNPGRIFAGMGGNFRIQNARLDPLHIEYILNHMRVAYGRVAMPWNSWQPDENSPPPLAASADAARSNIGAGRAGGVVNQVAPAMEIAQKLAKQNTPMILSCWSPPPWAVMPSAGPAGRGFPRGQRLNPAKWDSISKSIGSYLVYFKEQCSAEPEYFSFNESNIGINVRQSPEEHNQAIKKLGAQFQSLGLKTKMLLGDTGDVPPVDFIRVALNDPESRSYIGAVAFHSWRGATDDQYQKWADVAAAIGVPLFDAEGGNDAQAYAYPEVLRESWYALDEAAEYVRIMRICQPKSILQWQLTENYSVLWADEMGQLHPSQRFFNLKQFGIAPADSNWIPVASSNDLVLPAACVHKTSGVYTVHLVNNGASRQVTLTGLPGTVASMQAYVTDEKRGIQQLAEIQFSRGTAQFELPGQALTTLITDPR